jgi:hypothetical protein
MIEKFLIFLGSYLKLPAPASKRVDRTAVVDRGDREKA